MAKKGIALKKGKKLSGAKTLGILRPLRGNALASISSTRAIKA